MLSVVMLSVVMLSVVEPIKYSRSVSFFFFEQLFCFKKAFKATFAIPLTF
jgi:hypothetical protein